MEHNSRNETLSFSSVVQLEDDSNIDTTLVEKPLRKVFDRCFHSKKSFVKVEFQENLSVENVVEVINQLPNAQVILWYVGCYGLRKKGVQFYQHSLITPVLRKNFNATFWLIDLTAWRAFKDPVATIARSDSCCENIDSFKDKQLKCIRSSEIFKKMQSISSPEVIKYFQKALQRDFIRQVSANYPDVNIKVGEIFSYSCSIMSPFYNWDTAKAYSLFQYLEGCLLIDEIIEQVTLNNRKCIFSIVFAVPNDELKYYKDNENSFQKDVEFLISKKYANLNFESFTLLIKFLAFDFGSSEEHRPYNAKGKILKKIALEDITYISEKKN